MAFYATGTSYPVSAPAAFGWTIVLVFFAYANFVLTGYFKDVSADRATGYNTLPVVFGGGVSTIVSDLIAAVICSSVFFTVKNSGIPLPGSIPALLMISAGMIACVISQIRLHTTRDEHHAHRAIVPVVHSYLLLLGGIAALQRPGWLVAILVMYAAFVFVLNNRPERSQI
jgi:4-hydroxybenzoate polyprenyltransferase